MSLVLTKDLARTIERAEIKALESRLSAVKKIAGNPMDVEIRKFGNATAFSVKNIPGPAFNRVLGLSGEEMECIDSIISFYKEREIPVRFEITPAHVTPDLLKALAEKGYFQCGFHTALWGSLPKEFIPETESDPSISIREFEENEFAIFGDIYTKCFNMPSFLKEHVAQNNKVLHHNENWNFYMAMYEGEPAGLGVFFKHDRIGMLAASATLPEFRNKGVHSALILKRLEKARQLHCDLIVGQAAYGTVSQRNMERATMKIAYTKGVWS